jgi:hypothetical protein
MHSVPFSSFYDNYSCHLQVIMQEEPDSSHYSDDHSVPPPMNSRRDISFSACVNRGFASPSPDARFEVLENNLCRADDIRCSGQVHDILPPAGDAYGAHGLVIMDLSVLSLLSTSRALIGLVKPARLWCGGDIPPIPQEILIAIYSMLNPR